MSRYTVAAESAGVPPATSECGVVGRTLPPFRAGTGALRRALAPSTDERKGLVASRPRRGGTCVYARPAESITVTEAIPSSTMRATARGSTG